MRKLKEYEISVVSGGAPATADEVNAFFEGIVWGALDGLATGVTVGGRQYSALLHRESERY